MPGSSLTLGRNCQASQVEIFQPGDVRHAVLLGLCLQCSVLFVCLSKLQAITTVKVGHGVNGLTRMIINKIQWNRRIDVLKDKPGKASSSDLLQYSFCV